MSFATIAALQVPGSPEVANDVSGDAKRYTYRGAASTLSANQPVVGDDWDGLEVVGVTFRAIGSSTHAEMIVEARSLSSGILTIGAAAVTNNEFPLLELDNETVEKSIRQHPAFAWFTEAHWAQIDLWIAETDSGARKQLKYWERDKDGAAVGSLQTLGTIALPDNSQQDFAALYLLGVTSYVDHAPVARRTSLYKGTDAPTTADIGQKISGDPFTGVPSGYEWVKRADRATKQGRGFYWTRVEEWIGARAVLVDKDEIFL